MTTPVWDFVRQYAESGTVRMHMPAHKGVSLLGCERYDLTELAGADSLFCPTGILAESEQNASRLFGSPTFYSTEGSSLCIRAMLYLAVKYAVECGKKPVIAAARNVHRAFLTAAVLLDFEILWLPRSTQESYLTCRTSIEEIDAFLSKQTSAPIALYLTSPDYLGNMAEIQKMANFCHHRGMLLLVDNAHGAYLKFLPQSLHPIDLGADLCCDSAHKTLPALTGTAYVHLSEQAPAFLRYSVREALQMFASTSPSYLLLASLDCCNALLEKEYPEKLCSLLSCLEQCKEQLRRAGYVLCGAEPMKLTLAPKARGYTGEELAAYLRAHQVECEMADPDFLVLMPSPMSELSEVKRVADLLCDLVPRPLIQNAPPILPQLSQVLSPREAMLGKTEKRPISDCVGRIYAELPIQCPPAVPIAVCGERLNAAAVTALSYYGVKSCTVCRESPKGGTDEE